MNNRGPRSDSGKAAVSHNSLRHGLTAAAIVLPSEYEDDWTSFHEEVRVRFDAEGPVEVALASRVAELLWRLRRVARVEAQSVSVGQMRRDVIAYDRTQTAPAAPVSESDEDPAARRARGREQYTKLFGIYARSQIAGTAADRYLETLPVLLPDDRALDTIMRYEAHLSRLLKHALHELEALQDRRRGTATPLARVDIS
jgi:hypothetical protein